MERASGDANAGDVARASRLSWLPRRTAVSLVALANFRVAQHFIRNKTHDGGEVDFHQGLGIIASPLFETSTLFESAETRTQGCGSNSTQPMSDPNEVKGDLSSHNLPTVNLIQNLVFPRSAVREFQVFPSPCD